MKIDKIINVDRLTTALAIILLLIPAVYYYYLIDVLEGDPAIYLSFAKHFFEQPFAFGAPANVSFGATSPFYLFILSAVYEWFGVPGFLFPLKILNLLFFYLGTLFVFLSIMRLKTYDVIDSLTRRNTLLYFFISVSVCITCFGVIDNSARLYESSFVFLYASLLMFLFITRALTLFFVAASFSYLVRPELLALQGLFFLAFAFKEKRTVRQFAIVFALFILSFIPLIMYHIYMFAWTGDWLPSSLVSRATRNSDVSHLRSIYYQVKTAPQYLFFLCIPLLFYMNKQKISLSKVSRRQLDMPFCFFIISAIIFVIFTFIWIGSKSFSSRYTEFSIPILCACSIALLAKPLSTLKNSTILTIFMIAPVLASSYKILVPEYNINSTIANRLAPELAAFLNVEMEKEEKFAIYEIQTQYFIDRHVVSLDARVGHEMTDFALGQQSLLSALSEHRVNFISVDPNVSPTIRMDPFYKFLLKTASKSKLNETTCYNTKENNVCVSLIKINDNTSFSMWKYIFKLQHLA